MSRGRWRYAVEEARRVGPDPWAGLWALLLSLAFWIGRWTA